MFILVLTTFCLFEDSKFTSASSLQRNQSNLINNNPKKKKEKKNSMLLHSICYFI